MSGGREGEVTFISYIFYIPYKALLQSLYYLGFLSRNWRNIA
jgi:hypothetical protein